MNIQNIDALKEWQQARDNFELPKTNLWVFGYGSLMWNPGFDFKQAQSAMIYGYHRQLCLWSTQYRGTPDVPGLILGLDRGGSCRGTAYQLPDNKIETIGDYLFEREMVTNLYRPIITEIQTIKAHRAKALTFVVKRNHIQYAGRLPFEEQVKIVKRAQGPRGSNIEYIKNTAEQLTGIGICNTDLHKIISAL